MKNLINTIQKELDSNNLYLNHCNSEIQLLRSLNGIGCEGNDLTPILKLKPIKSLKRILTELLTKKEKHNITNFLISENEEEQKIEMNENFEKANLQIVESYEGKNDNELTKNLSQVNFFQDIIKHIE